MKKLYFILLLAICFVNCDNNDDANQTLPPETQTGKNILACTIDGKNFVHNKGVMNCFYQYMDGGYYFGISGENYSMNAVGVTVGTINKTISEGETLILTNHADGNAGGSIFFRTSDFDGEGADTNSEYTGEMHITKFDPQNQIVSGTFWFDVKHPATGKRVEVRNGRFDAVFGM